MNRSEFICDYCNRSFTKKYNLQNHIQNQHLKLSCHCDVCDRYYCTINYMVHLSTGHNRNGEPFPECDLCGKIFTRKQNLKSHIVTAHLNSGPQYRCGHCNKILNSQKNLTKHINKIHNPFRSYPTCMHCHKSFKKKINLASHIKSKHGTIEDLTSKCLLCDKAYSNNRSLKRHIEMFHGEKDSCKCELCPKAYNSKQSLRRHIRTVHEKRYENIVEAQLDECDDKFVCDSCYASFDQEPDLRQHIKTQHSFEVFYNYCKKSLIQEMADKAANDKQELISNFKCEFCKHTFPIVYELKTHMRITHSKELITCNCNVCFSKFYSKEALERHKKTCLPPPGANACAYCDKLFTDTSSLEFHIRIFHPQAQIADTVISSTNNEDNEQPTSYKCSFCERIYYSDRSMKHHIKLKHIHNKDVACEICGKVCSNKYYLASHIKVVHNNDLILKCEYCDKQFKSRRNIRRHIEYTHMGMQRYKCIECEGLFKEKRSLRKHVRTKHANSVKFPECHICHKRFESARSCKTHLKLLHSINMNTFACHLCPISFSSSEALEIHKKTKHLAEDAIYKCNECNLVFKGPEKFEKHNLKIHVTVIRHAKEKEYPRCIICMKDFSSRKTLKRHIKKFHMEFDANELATYGSKRRTFDVDCVECIKNFTDEFYLNVYQKLKHLHDSVIFKCEFCTASYNVLEFNIQRHKLENIKPTNGSLILSELCTAEMGEESENYDSDNMEPESTTQEIFFKHDFESSTSDVIIKQEAGELNEADVKQDLGCETRLVTKSDKVKLNSVLKSQEITIEPNKCELTIKLEQDTDFDIAVKIEPSDINEEPMSP